MSALEQEIIEKIRKLDEAQKKQILEFIQEIDEQESTDENWSDRARTLRLKLRHKYGVNRFADNQAVLDEVREERLNDLTGGR